MYPDAPFAASRFVARPQAEVAAAVLALADRAWTLVVPAGRCTLTRRLGGDQGCAGSPHTTVSGMLVAASDPGGLEVEVTVGPCGERASELLLRPRWSKAAPEDPARLEAGQLLASIAMDRLAADLAAALTTDPTPQAAGGRPPAEPPVTSGQQDAVRTAVT